MQQSLGVTTHLIDGLILMLKNYYSSMGLIMSTLGNAEQSRRTSVECQEKLGLCFFGQNAFCSFTVHVHSS